MSGDSVNPHGLSEQCSPKRKASVEPQHHNVEDRLESPASHIDHCVICLCPVTERAIAVPCNHSSFDFVCLVNWLEHRSTCPLCTKEISNVEYDWASPTDFKSYKVTSTSSAPAKGQQAQPSRPTGFVSNDSIWTTNSHDFRGRGRFFRHRDETVEWGPPSVPRGRPDPNVAAIQRRRDIYRHRLYSLHVGSNAQSKYHDFTPLQFAESSHLQSRAKLWIRRELQVFSYLNPDQRQQHDEDARPSSSSASRHATAAAAVATTSASLAPNAEFLMHYLIAILKTVDIKDSSGHAQDLLSEFLGREHANLFLHELYAWLRSPYAKLEDWDRHVQYSRDRKQAVFPTSSSSSR